MGISIVLEFYGISSAENVISSQSSAGNLLELSVFLSCLAFLIQEFLKDQHLCLDNRTHQGVFGLVVLFTLHDLLCITALLQNSVSCLDSIVSISARLHKAT